MKIICIGHNYDNHNSEMAHERPSAPVFFTKPDTAILRNNDPFYIPSFTDECHYETELVIKINRIVKAIDERFAHRCYSEVAVGIDFTARDRQRECVASGLPWEICKAFDKSAPVPNTFIPLAELGGDINALHFALDINGKRVQEGVSGDMIFSPDRLIAYVSQFITLKMGDLIFTGTPAGVGPVKIGDRLVASLEGHTMLDFEVR